MSEIITGLPEQAKIVVIGGGGAGLTAALTAAEAGTINIVLLEKRGSVGGTSALAGGIFACESPVQARQHIVADRDDLFRRAMDWAHWRQVDPRIVRVFINRSGDTIRWLENKGIEFQIIRFYPDQVPLVQHNVTGTGAQLTKTLTREARQRGVTILTKAAVTTILRDDSGYVIGVRVKRHGVTMDIRSSAVIVSTGGFAGNPELLQRLCPSYNSDLVLSGLPLTGDGFLMAENAGAAVANFVTVLKEGPRLDPHQWPLHHFERDPLALWVNLNGERFVDETLGYHVFESVNALLAQPKGISFALFDDSFRDIFRITMPDIDVALEGEVKKGRVFKTHSWPEMAGAMGCESVTLEATVDRYNTLCDRGYDEDFSKEYRYLRPLTVPPFFAIKGISTILDTIGGIIINDRMEVLDINNRPIPGLFAAGTVTSGWESEVYCSDLSASAFGFAVNSGRIAGENAAHFTSGN
jgi:fumarate reductase flavoprotein subunit